jgi:hypothetical protein
LFFKIHSHNKLVRISSNVSPEFVKRLFSGQPSFHIQS